MSYGDWHNVGRNTNDPLPGEQPSKQDDHWSIVKGAFAVIVFAIGALAGSGVFMFVGLGLLLWAVAS